MNRFPPDFSDLLSARGRRALAGKDAKARGALAEAQFFSCGGLLDARWVKAVPEILARSFGDLMVEMTQRAPPANASLLDTGTEELPKIGRMLTNPMTEASEARAAECGLIAMITSASYKGFVEVLTGRPMRGPDRVQVLCYRPGDYAGPHTDHHPQSPAHLHGYVDIHLTFTTSGIDHQYLVYGPDGHLDQIQSVTEGGTVTVYKLPFWHYVTPLVTKTQSARRWLVLGTFFFD